MTFKQTVANKFAETAGHLTVWIPVVIGLHFLGFWGEAARIVAIIFDTACGH